MLEGKGQRSTPALATIERIAVACVVSAGVDGVGISLVTKQGNRGVVFTTDDVAAQIEELQYALGDGPCVTVANTGNPIFVNDLLDVHEGIAMQWPAFLVEAEAIGVRSVVALPLTIGAIALGTMDLYRRSPGPLEPAQLSAALLAADAAAAALLGLNDGYDGFDEGGSDWSPYPVTVHQAAGMIKIQLDVDIQEALIRLRAAAFAEERSISDLANDVVTGRRRFTKEDV